MLAIEDLVMEIGRGARAERVLRGVSLSVEPGEVVGLVGESGAGKSMIGRVVLGVAPANAHVVAGRVRFFADDLLGISERRRRTLLGRDIALIPQDPMSSLNPVLRIERQLTDVMRLHLALGRQAARARALALLEAVHIAAPARVLRQYPHELSGGMRQRVLIAIAFACEPKLIVADEPTTALDVTVQRQVLRLMRDMQRRTGAGVLFITHDLGVVAKLCDRVSVLHAGRVVEAGTVAAVIDRPQHPYTRALLAATPRYDRPADALVPVPAELTRRLWAEARALDRQPGRRSAP
ncbi:MAG: ABC transporter ATP-binding protein [Alphaproteobacteria bacterium]